MVSRKVLLLSAASLSVMCTSTMALAGPALQAAVLPSSRSTSIDTPVTIFASMINGGDSIARSCGISLRRAGLPVDISYQAMQGDNATPAASADTPVDIEAGAAQAFVVTFTANAPVAAGTLRLTYACSDDAGAQVEAPVVDGVNALSFSASATPSPDVLTIAQSPSGDGYIRIPTAGGAEAMAISAVNIGVGTNGKAEEADLIAMPDTGGVALPINLFVCETNAVTGACLDTPSTFVHTKIGAAPKSYTVFANADAEAGIPDFPDLSRVYLRFYEEDSAQSSVRGQGRGASGLAVTAPSAAASSPSSSTLPEGVWEARFNSGNGSYHEGLLFVSSTGSVNAIVYSDSDNDRNRNGNDRNGNNDCNGGDDNGRNDNDHNGTGNNDSNSGDDNGRNGNDNDHNGNGDNQCDGGDNNGRNGNDNDHNGTGDNDRNGGDDNGRNGNDNDHNGTGNNDSNSGDDNGRNGNDNDHNGTGDNDRNGGDDNDRNGNDNDHNGTGDNDRNGGDDNGRRGSSATLLSGTISTDGSDGWTASTAVLDLAGNTGGVSYQLGGNWEAKSFTTGTYVPATSASAASIGNGSLRAAFSRDYDRVTSVATLGGSFDFYDGRKDVGNLTVSSNGDFSGTYSVPGSTQTCNVSGGFTSTNVSTNLYEVTLSLQNCSAAGSYNGMATLRAEDDDRSSAVNPILGMAMTADNNSGIVLDLFPKGHVRDDDR